MKSIKKFLVVLLAACTVLSVAAPLTKASAAEKPAQVEGLTVTRASKTAVKLTWSQAYNAAKYQVSMKAGKGGAYKTVKNTKGTSATIKNLEIGTTYYIKVRGYAIENGKKIYGKYSVITKTKLENWVYLTDVMEPYSGTYSLYKKADTMNTFTMGGTKYNSGLIIGKLDSGYTDDVYDVYLNLGGKYSSMTFEWGAVDGYDTGYGLDEGDAMSIQLYADDVMVDEMRRNKGDLPITYTLDTSDVYKLRFIKGSGFTAGLGNIKLYY